MAAQFLELGRVFQKVDQLGDVILGFLDTGNVAETDFDLLLVHELGLALAERQRATAAATALHLSHEEYPYGDEQDHREPGYEYLRQEALFIGGLALDTDVIIEQRANQGIVAAFRAVCHEATAVLLHAANGLAFDRNRSNFATLDRAQELRIFDFIRGIGRTEIAKDHHEYQGDNHPQHQIFCHVVQSTTSQRPD